MIIEDGTAVGTREIAIQSARRDIHSRGPGIAVIVNGAAVKC